MRLFNDEKKYTAASVIETNKTRNTHTHMFNKTLTYALVMDIIRGTTDPSNILF